MMNNLIREYINKVAHRAWMQERTHTFRDILMFLRSNGLNLAGASDARFAAMITHTINNGD